MSDIPVSHAFSPICVSAYKVATNARFDRITLAILAIYTGKLRMDKIESDHIRREMINPIFFITCRKSRTTIQDIIIPGECCVKPSSAIPVKSRNLILLFSLCFIAIIIPVVTASGLQEVGAHANGPSFDPGYQMDTCPQGSDKCELTGKTLI